MTRDATNTPASHTSALGELFIAEEGAGAQEGKWKLAKLINLILQKSAAWDPGDEKSSFLAIRLLGMTKIEVAYGNSRVTNLAGFAPVLDRVLE
jgi:hypothetical protein